MTDTRLTAPPGYTPAQQAIWDDTVTRLTASGRIFRTPPHLLDAYVQAHTSLAKISRLITGSEPLLIRGQKTRPDGTPIPGTGTPIPNPAYEQQRATLQTIAALAKTLGLATAGMPPADTHPVDAARWCEAHHRRECTHHRRKCGHDTKLPPPQDGCCHMQAVTGLAACRLHAGKTSEQARRDGQAALARLYGTPLDVTAAEALLSEVRWTAGHVEALRQAVTELETGQPGRPGGALFWGTTRTVTRDGITEVTEQAVPHVILAAYTQEREHLVACSRAALAAGAQAETIRIAQTTGAAIIRALDDIFDALQLLDWQRALIPEVVPRAMRALEAAPDPPA